MFGVLIERSVLLGSAESLPLSMESQGLSMWSFPTEELDLFSGSSELQQTRVEAASFPSPRSAITLLLTYSDVGADTGQPRIKRRGSRLSLSIGEIPRE